MATQSIPRITEEEYLALERAAEYRSEFVDGQIFAMAGGSPPHSLIAANWIAQFVNKLEDRRCRVYTSDLRVRTGKTGSFVYPDVSVACGDRGVSPYPDVLVDPVVIVEVLSPSTADYDRGKKFELYREISSLKDYILTHTETPWVEHFSRQSDSTWIFREYQGLEASVAIPSLECIIPLARVYREVLN